MRTTISSRDRGPGQRKAFAVLLLAQMVAVDAAAQLPPESARSSMLPVQAPSQSGLEPGVTAGISLPAVILLAPSSSVALPIEVTPADIGQRGVLIRIRGLPEAITLNEGHLIAPGSWAVPIAALPRLRVVVPAGLAGKSVMTVTLVTIDGSRIAEARSDVVIAAAGLIAPGPPARQAVGPGPPARANQESATASKPALIEMAPATPVAPVLPTAKTETPEVERRPEQKPLAQPPPIQKEASAAPAKPAMDTATRQRAEGMMTRGRALLAEGNIVSARLFFERAANDGLAEAALALGATYDPSELLKALAHGIKPDPAMARRWYEKAASLGNTVAAQRLERLGK